VSGRIGARIVLGAACALTIGWGSLSRAQAPPAQRPPAQEAAPPATETQPADAAQKQRFERFEKEMHGVKLVGRFTVTGRDDGDLKPEEYIIRSVKKLEEDDLWLFQCRIKYGNTNVSLPLPLVVRWAGDTPVITLDKFRIPGMGTFDARVVIHDRKYAGTWSHDDVGGHLFGEIQEATPEELAEPEADDK